MDRSLPRVIIIGGGFGGLSAARALREPVQVTLIDRRNHHLFQPLLYQVATAGLNPSNIASPIRRILRYQKNAEVLLAECRTVDLHTKLVVLEDGEIPYDYLVVATGARHSYFGHPEWAHSAPGLKSIRDALEIRRRVLSAFEMAERESDAERRKAWLTFVVVGAGPTGVELSGALCEIARHALARDFRHIDPAQARVILLEGSDRVLPPYVPELSVKARSQLERLGVEVQLRKLVTNIDGDGVTIGEERIAARTVLWAAGVMGSRLGRMLGVPLDRAGRVIVQPDLSLADHPEAFVVGDLASLTIDGKPVPGVAPAALQEGKHTAHNIMRLARGADQTVSLFRQGLAGNHWTVERGGAGRKASHLGPTGVADLVVCSRDVPDRVSQSDHGDAAMDLVFLDIRSGGAADHRAAAAGGERGADPPFVASMPRRAVSAGDARSGAQTRFAPRTVVAPRTVQIASVPAGYETSAGKCPLLKQAMPHNPARLPATAQPQLFRFANFGNNSPLD